jgi:hypothetical protein
MDILESTKAKTSRRVWVNFDFRAEAMRNTFHICTAAFKSNRVQSREAEIDHPDMSETFGHVDGAIWKIARGVHNDIHLAHMPGLAATD